MSSNSKEAFYDNSQQILLGRNNPKMAAIRLQYDRILPSGMSIHTFKYWKYKLASNKNSELVPEDLVKISDPAKLVPVKVAEEVAVFDTF